MENKRSRNTWTFPAGSNALNVGQLKQIAKVIVATKQQKTNLINPGQKITKLDKFLSLTFKVINLLGYKITKLIKLLLHIWNYPNPTEWKASNELFTLKNATSNGISIFV